MKTGNGLKLPTNVTPDYLRECEDCDLCVLKVNEDNYENSIGDYTVKYELSCAHMDACFRMAMIKESNETNNSNQ